MAITRNQDEASTSSSPSAAGIPDRFKDGEGRWTGFAARARWMTEHGYRDMLARGLP